MCEVVLIHDETKETGPLDTVEPGEFDKQLVEFQDLRKVGDHSRGTFTASMEESSNKFMKTERCQHTITSSIGTLASRPIMSKNLPGKTDENTLATSLILDK